MLRVQTPPITQLDLQAIELLMSLRDNPEVQKDPALFKIFNETILFAAAQTVPPTTAQLQKIVSESFPLVPLLHINTSGRDGEHGFPGIANICPRQRGHNGEDGTHGENARDINLRLYKQNGLVCAQWEEGSAALTLEKDTTTIFLRAVGGMGGDGGRGGQGGPGIKGFKGRDATEQRDGADGERGGSGAEGGNGGIGGNGGRGGKIKVYIKPEDTDLLQLLSPPHTEGGAPGYGGVSGRGGKGGPGGEGGSSHTWTEIRHGTRLVSNGRGGVSSESYTYAVTRINPGGSKGPSGYEGKEGIKGANGEQGLEGLFEVIFDNKT